MREQMERCLQEITQNLEEGIVPFWLHNGIDKKYGGYLVCFDENGNPTGDTDKQIVTQTRMIWGFSALYKRYGLEKYRLAARQGVDFFIRNFWDKQYGGWYWMTTREGSLLDNGKVIYGQTFAIYCLSEYTLATGDKVGQEYACKTFDLMQKYAADTARGGYYENLERDWTLSPSGFCAGDLKSLDIHMHTMEAFTTLYECTGEEIHARKLKEVMDLILDKMFDKEIGCGFNQFDASFHRKPAINIRRTWNAERETGEVMEQPTDSTSYGHNIELVWLLNRACDILQLPYHTYDEVAKKVAEHTLKYGFDHELGGVFRDGPHVGEPLVKDKEWWQNCETLVGLLDIYERCGDENCLKAFFKTWEFDSKYMINHEVGEWRQLLTHNGKGLTINIGNQWKCIYHTGRAMMECKERLERLL
ncbi:MAG: AGE family epimerase/isomerase, partial [Lachnospiraceae bacterium]|nr:AGE family epimerase/isomerase [Lachnospiraceae bacterium]